MNDTNGKFFQTDKNPLAKDLARRIPFLTGKSLNGDYVTCDDVFSKSRITILALNMSNLGAQQIEPFKHFSTDVPLLDVHVIIGRLKAAIIGPFARYALKRNTPRDRWKCTLLTRLSPGYLGSLGAWNRYGGYVLLIDQEGMARWRTCGTPSAEELHSFKNAIDSLRR
jgi:hypothetical protein